ncbi:MAG: hypothetical protein EZS28_003009 [Streblomastix strix]|uniref:MIR domain-containing protein n=1 Tax=Streblomastix strix TaxID=222440 RepID=A0A5J4X2P1_9EUKA|nr:MAG: hypothetical protein EZS28_003009 [Streblomastix strix]
MSSSLWIPVNSIVAISTFKKNHTLPLLLSSEKTPNLKLQPVYNEGQHSDISGGKYQLWIIELAQSNDQNIGFHGVSGKYLTYGSLVRLRCILDGFLLCAQKQIASRRTGQLIPFIATQQMNNSEDSIWEILSINKNVQSGQPIEAKDQIYLKHHNSETFISPDFATSPIASIHRSLVSQLDEDFAIPQSLETYPLKLSLDEYKWQITLLSLPPTRTDHLLFGSAVSLITSNNINGVVSPAYSDPLQYGDRGVGIIHFDQNRQNIMVINTIIKKI